MFKLKLVFSFFLFLLPGFLRAQTTPSIPNDAPLTIETHEELGFMGGILGPTMEYHLHGKKISHYQDFKKLIYPLHDPEASQFIREAQETDFISWVFLATGLTITADVSLFYKPITFFNSNVPDRLLTFLLTSQISFGLFGRLHNIAEARKFNAVQRYNVLMKNSPPENALEITPILYACNNGVVLGGHLTF